MLTAIFIDGGYLEKCANSGVDFAALAERLTENDRLLQAYYYNGYPYDPQHLPKATSQNAVFYENKIRFFRKLETLPKFTCRYGYTIYRDGVFMQKGVDTLIVVDMLTLAARKTVDSIKLLAGDRDLMPGVKAARELGIIVNLFTFDERTYAKALVNECDKHIEMNKDCTLP